MQIVCHLSSLLWRYRESRLMPEQTTEINGLQPYPELSATVELPIWKTIKAKMGVKIEKSAMCT